MTDKMKSIGTYDFPARDRVELFGDDQLVNVQWLDQMFILMPGCFRVPKSMKWSEFKSQVVEPWASVDPDYDKNKAVEWFLDEEHIEPGADQSLTDIGFVHKGLIKFRVS